MIRIYHSDPFPLFTKGLEMALTKYAEINWVGSQMGYEGLLKNLNSCKADILITNNYVCDGRLKVEMSDKLVEIRNAFPRLKVVLLTMAEAIEIQRTFKDKYLVEAFITKNIDAEEIFEVLKLVNNAGRQNCQ